MQISSKPSAVLATGFERPSDFLSRPYFPWKLFARVFLATIALITVLVVCAAYFLGPHLKDSFASTSLAELIAIGLVLASGGSASVAFYLVLPLRNLILRALRISAKKYVNEFEEDDVLLDQYGPYVELEEALDKIRQKLQRRRLQLSHEREESQALMRSMDDAIMSVNLDEKVVFYNARFAAQFMSEGAQGGGSSLQFWFRDVSVLELFSNALKTGESGSYQFSAYNRLTDRDHDFLLKVSALREEVSLHIYGALGVFHDISEIKKVERIRHEFVENASHELRTPLTAIKGYLATIEDDVAAQKFEQVPQFLKIVIRNVDRLVELVNDMLLISSLDSGPTLRLEKVNPLVLTEEVLSRLSQMALERNITVTASSELQSIDVDTGKIEQVLVNLIGNALKYIPPNGRVEVRWLNAGPELVQLIVRDNGPGISAEHRSRLFERFYRIDKGRSREVGGTGLGLSIVKHIVQSHGGRVWVESEIGKGAQFICELPQENFQIVD